MENNTFLEVVSTFSPSDEILPHPNISYYLYIVAVLIPCLLFHFKPPKQAKSHGSDKVPQPYPYLIPVLAHAVPFAWNTPRFVTNVARRCNGNPTQLRLFITNMFLLTSPKDIIALFTQSSQTTNMPYRRLAVGKMFKMPQKANNLFLSDDSGLASKPRPGSSTKPEERINHPTHTSLMRLLTGPGLKPLVARFAEFFPRNLANANISHHWMEFPDLFSFMRELMLKSTAEAIFGPNLLALNPNLCRDLLEYDTGVSAIAKGVPRWMSPRVYQARDKCLEAFKKYHCFLREHPEYLRATGSETGYDTVGGAEIVRMRQNLWSNFAIMDANAQASEDFGFLWGANHNASHTAFWLLCDMLLNPRILSRFRSTIHDSKTPADSPFDALTLTKSPYLSSLYAETLRLRSADTILREPTYQNLRIGPWLFPRAETIAISIWTTHNDEKAWNTGSAADPHPLRSFWDERFLVSADGRLAGPAKSNPQQQHHHPSPQLETPPADDPPPTSASKPSPTSYSSSSSAISFSTIGLDGIFIPYGGGQAMCPGRMFAKQEILFTLAVLLDEYDIEMGGGRAPEIDFRSFGTGTLAPGGRTAFRIRKRAAV